MKELLVNMLGSAGPMVLAAIIPVIVGAIRGVIPKIPAWLLPILATTLGPAIDYAVAWMGSYQASPLVAAGLGLAAIGIREVWNQVGQLLSGKQTLAGEKRE